MSVECTLTYLDDDGEEEIVEAKHFKVKDGKYWQCVSEILDHYWKEGYIRYVDTVDVTDLGISLSEVSNRNILQVELEVQLDRHSEPPEWFKKKIFDKFDETHTESICWKNDYYEGENEICKERDRLSRK